MRSNNSGKNEKYNVVIEVGGSNDSITIPGTINNESENKIVPKVKLQNCNNSFISSTSSLQDTARRRIKNRSRKYSVFCSLLFIFSFVVFLTFAAGIFDAVFISSGLGLPTILNLIVNMEFNKNIALTRGSQLILENESLDNNITTKALGDMNLFNGNIFMIDGDYKIISSLNIPNSIIGSSALSMDNKMIYDIMQSIIGIYKDINNIDNNQQPTSEHKRNLEKIMIPRLTDRIMDYYNNPVFNPTKITKQFVSVLSAVYENFTQTVHSPPVLTYPDNINKMLLSVVGVIYTNEGKKIYVVNTVQPMTHGLLLYSNSAFGQIVPSVVAVGLASVLIMVFTVWFFANRNFTKYINKLDEFVNPKFSNKKGNMLYKSQLTAVETKFPEICVNHKALINFGLDLLKRKGVVLSKEVLKLGIRGEEIKETERTIETPKISVFTKFGNWIDQYLPPPYEIQMLKEATDIAIDTIRNTTPFMPSQVIKSLIEKDAISHRITESRNVTSWFSDIKDFTTIIDELTSRDPGLATKLYNDFFGECSRVIEDVFGTIDKWNGDSIVAFFNAPNKVAQHCLFAIIAVFACRKRIDILNSKEWQPLGIPHIKLRYGIHMGIADVGLIGSDTRVSYTAMGPTINRASRNESANKIFGTSCLCSKEVRDQTSDYILFRHIDNAAVKGTKDIISLYEPIGFIQYPHNLEISHLIGSEFFPSQTIIESVNLYNKATQLYSAGGVENWYSALDLYQDYKNHLSPTTTDLACERMIQQCIKLIDNPPDNWQGGIYLDDK